MAEIVYMLCGVTSLACALLLLRAYQRSRTTTLLLWSCIGFAGLSVSNVLVFVDLVIVPDADLSVVRAGISAGSMLVLVGGIAWTAR